MRVAICSLADDFHALVIARVLKDRYDVACAVVETDRLRGLTWYGSAPGGGRVAAVSGEPVDVRELDAIWWRRSIGSPKDLNGITDPAQIDVIAKDSREAVLGLLSTEFRGAWVSDPYATLRAQNKLVQLRTAERLGFRVPKTLVSQNPDDIRAFCSMLPHGAVVKVVKGTRLGPVLTTMVNDTLLQSDAAMQVSPAMYQEFIPGLRHLRVNCFGDTIMTALIESPDLDWRPNLAVPITPVALDDTMACRLRGLVASLGLRMGIADFKLNEDGEPVFLELNPQGQFLFLEGACGLPLIAAFCDFFLNETPRGPVLDACDTPAASR